MRNDEAKNLYNKYLEGNCTPEEEAIVESWVDHLVFDNDRAFDSDEEDLLRAKANIYDRVKDNGAPVPPGSKIMEWPYRLLAAAAIFIVVVGIGAYFLVESPKPATYANDVEPGTTKAILVLANGKEIILNDAKSGEIAEQKGVKITKSKEGQLVYDATAIAAVATPVPSPENKISPTTSESSGTPVNAGEAGGLNAVKTPRGGQYEIILPDGTKVWLNAASSLKFPSTFLNLGERKVELIGEAYFEVAKVTTLLGKLRKSKRIPFIVKTPQQEVKVLGTHFNVNSYKDEPNTKTTLLEGSVSVSIPEAWGTSTALSGRPTGAPERGIEKILKPGEQSINTGSAINIVNVDTDQAIAWKNGDFMFNKEPLESIMRKVSRWYDVEVVFEDKKSLGMPFGGTISKFSKVSDVLAMLELTNKIKFSIKGKKIIVLK